MRTNKIAYVVAAALVVLTVAGIVLTRRSEPRQATAGPAASSASPAWASPEPPPPTPGADIRGPLDLLLIGVDTRVTIPDWEPHADALMLLHLDAGLRNGYLYSLPRDLRVDIPGMGRHKITEAMSRGSRVPGSDRPSVEQGYELLTRTVSAYTGIKEFQAGAILTFGGLAKLTDALGGVTLNVDQKVVSAHRKPDGTMRALKPGGGGYTGPQATYLPGTRTLTGWQAIDFARQRYGLPDGDYDRQRHQRQLVKALLTKAQQAGPAQVPAIVTALGDSLVYVGGRSPIEYAYALSSLTPADLTLVTLPGASIGSGGGYAGEQLKPVGTGFLKAVARNEPAEYLAAHPELS